MRLRLIVPEKNIPTLMEKLNDWNANVTSKDESGSHPSVVSLGFEKCKPMVRLIISFST